MLPPRDCTVCGATYQTNQPHQRVCSTHCRNRRPRPYRHVRQRIERSADRRPCLYCGTEFAYHPKLRSTFCSYRCRGLHSAQTTIGAAIEWRCAAKDCARCGTRHFRRSIYCTKRCSQIGQYKYEPVSHLAPCLVCCRSFITKQGNAKYCDECRHDVYRRARKVAKLRREALTNVRPTTRRRVYLRDDWMCQLCGDPVDRDAKVPNRYAPTIDHIRPVSAGGTDDEENLRTAHFICNSKRGAGEYSAVA